MIRRQITSINQVPEHYRRAYQASQAIGMACLSVETIDGDALIADEMIGFDPDNNMHHTLALLFAAQSTGFIVPVSETETTLAVYCVRIVTSNVDTRVQLGGSRWYAEDHKSNPQRAFRRAIVSAFADYYVQITEQ